MKIDIFVPSDPLLVLLNDVKRRYHELEKYHEEFFVKDRSDFGSQIRLELCEKYGFLKVNLCVSLYFLLFTILLVESSIFLGCNFCILFFLLKILYFFGLQIISNLPKNHLKTEDRFCYFAFEILSRFEFDFNRVHSEIQKEIGKLEKEKGFFLASLGILFSIFAYFHPFAGFYTNDKFDFISIFGLITFGLYLIHYLLINTVPLFQLKKIQKNLEEKKFVFFPLP